MELPNAHTVQGNQRENAKPEVVTLWMFRYHTGEPQITYSTPMLFEFFYAVDEAEARKKVDEFKEALIGPVYEELFEPCPHGFRMARRTLDGRVQRCLDGTVRPLFRPKSEENNTPS